MRSSASPAPLALRGQKVVLIQGATSLTGTFVDDSPAHVALPEGTVVTVNGVSFVLTYRGGAGGHDVILIQPDPIASISGPFSGWEGSPITLTGSATDSLVGGGSFTFAWSVTKDGQPYGSGGSGETFTFTPADQGTYAVTLIADDTYVTSPPATQTIDVSNVAPSLILSGAANVAEGALYTLTLSSSDPGNDTLASWAVTWGDGSAVEIVAAGGRVFNTSTRQWETTATATHVFADGLMNRPISAAGTDEDGTYAAGNTQVVQVTNVAPALVLSGAAAVAEGSVYTLTLSSNDPGDDTLSSWAVNWGDGSGLQMVTANGRVFNSSTGRWETSTTATHVFADGLMNRTISATGTDEDATYAAANTQVVQVTNVAPGHAPERCGGGGGGERIHADAVLQRLRRRHAVELGGELG